MKTLNRRTLLRWGAAASVAPLIGLRAEETGDRRLGIALLGLGNYATHQLAPALEKTRNARLTGIITGSPEKIPRWQNEYAISDENVYHYDNLEEVADNKEIDIVYVVTPTALHPEYTIRALKAGKHVICEKPMAPTVEECSRMIQAAKSRDKMLQIGYRLHWDPFHLRLMEATRENEFGKWRSIDTADSSRMTDFTGHNAWRIDKELGVAGSLYDLGVYAVQAALYSAHQLPVRVTATHSTDREEHFNEVPEHWEWELEFAGGRKAKGASSYGKNANWVRVETPEGKIEIEPAYGYRGQEGSTPAGPMNFPQVNQQQLQIEGQVEAILTGKASRVPGEMGRRDIRVLRGIMAAADSGQPHEFGEFEW